MKTIEQLQKINDSPIHSSRKDSPVKSHVIIGAIAGGGKGAAIGAAVGAGAGTAVQAATKGQQIQIPPETKLDFTLKAPITVTM
ncbi:MAG: hypothetical protein LAN62_09340 [Acidobacteriia bacterium]|nr:hypothetical protein [Terriglobia bacterium]